TTGPAGGYPDAGHRRRLRAVLLTRWAMGRILRSRKIEEDSDRWRRADLIVRSPFRQGSQLDRKWRHRRRPRPPGWFVAGCVGGRKGGSPHGVSRWRAVSSVAARAARIEGCIV